MEGFLIIGQLLSLYIIIFREANAPIDNKFILRAIEKHSFCKVLGVLQYVVLWRGYDFDDVQEILKHVVSYLLQIIIS